MITSVFKRHNIPALCSPLRKAFHSSNESFLHWTAGAKVKAQPGSFLGWTGMPLKLSFTKKSVLTKVWESGSRVEGSQNCNLQIFKRNILNLILLLQLASRNYLTYFSTLNIFSHNTYQSHHLLSRYSQDLPGLPRCSDYLAFFSMWELSDPTT